MPGCFRRYTHQDVGPVRSGRSIPQSKRHLSFNDLGCITLDELFCYAYAGWEGSVHDGRVLATAMRDDMKIPVGRYYLGDAGYPLVDQLMVPFKGVRCHLKEQEKASQRPSVQLRNVVERASSRLKRKFRFHKDGSAYHVLTYLKIIYGCCALLKLMNLNGEAVDDDRNGEDGDQCDTENEDAGAIHSAGERDDDYDITDVQARNNRKRDRVAVNMFRDYEAELRRTSRRTSPDRILPRGRRRGREIEVGKGGEAPPGVVVGVQAGSPSNAI